MSIKTISPAELKARLKEQPNLKIIDVRTPGEYRTVHLVQAENIPLDQYHRTDWVGKHTQENPLYVVCQSGMRAKQACQSLDAAGVPVVLIEGGTKACIEAGLDVVRGQQGLSLERQVRIVIGSMVLLGCALTFWVHAAWIVMPAFMGAGLVFAGITDTCPLAMGIARMPWNQARENTTCAPKKA